MLRRSLAPWCLLSLLFCGCGSEAEKGPLGRPFEGETVRVVVPKGLGYREAWESAANDWSAQTGAKVEFQEADVGGKPLVATAAAGSLVVFPMVQLADSVEHLAPLPESKGSIDDDVTGGSRAAAVPELGWDEMWVGLREKVAGPSKSAAAIPVCVPALVLYYREDLLAKPGLEPPKTWDEYAELVRKLPTWAPGKIVAEPWGGDFRATMFLARALPAAQHPGHRSAFFDTETAAPLINTPGFERALKEAVVFLKELSAESREFCLTASPADCRAEMLAGRAALAIAWEPGPDATATPFTPGKGREKPPARAEGISIGVVRLPGSKEVYNPSRGTWEAGQSVTLVGFGGLLAGVRRGGSEKSATAAWELAGRMWSWETPVPQPSGTILPFREGDLADPSRWVGSGLQGGEVQAYGMAVADSLRDRRMVVELPVPERELYRTSLSHGLTKALTGDVPPAEALRAIAIEWRQITEQVGADRLQGTYRRALGVEVPLPSESTSPKR